MCQLSRRRAFVWTVELNNMSTALTATKFPSLVQNIFIDLQKKFEENGQKECEFN